MNAVFIVKNVLSETKKLVEPTLVVVSDGSLLCNTNQTKSKLEGFEKDVLILFCSSFCI